MAYGNGYTPVEDYDYLTPGYYQATILEVTEEERDFGPMRKITFTIADHPKANPNLCTLFDYPANGEKWQKEIWNKEITKFFDAFKITRGDFNIENWKGQSGEITVRPQKEGSPYMEIKPFKTSLERKKKSQPQTADAPAQSTQKAPIVIDATNGFPEDIPF